LDAAELHQPLAETPWKERHVRDAIRAIVADADAAYDAVEDGRANWPSTVGTDRMPRLQWCHGAPGTVTHASGYLDEELLLQAAELVWDAGPPNDEKGAGLCHGTAGNGYAFLKTFARTGDELWLDRARAFAMHALEQVERLPGRYSLFRAASERRSSSRTASRRAPRFRSSIPGSRGGRGGLTVALESRMVASSL
jgi:hypothetical protein